VINLSDGVTLVAAALALANLVVLAGIVRRQRHQHRTLERLTTEIGKARIRNAARNESRPDPSAPKPAIRIVQNDH